MKQVCSENENFDVKRLDIKRIEELLHSGSLESCRQVLDSVVDEVRLRELQSFMLRLYVCMDIYVAARSFSRDIGITNEKYIERFGTVDEVGTKLMTVEDTLEFLYEIVEQCILWRIAAAKESGNSVLNNARDYIDKNYMNEDLNLKCVADAVGLSPSYLSTTFKREFGQNLSEYLTLARILRSKELLCCTSKRIYEVAYDVGFRDYRYFSQIFKKYTGQTPRQFQNSANVCPQNG
jgi:two-component system response regulator YesN